MPHLTRLVPPVAAVVLAAAAAAWPVSAGQEPGGRRAACGAYEVVPSGFRASGEATRLTIQKAGRLLVSLTDWSVISSECDDITADKIPELVVRTFSGGAHCCETLRVYALGDTPRLLLLYEANNAMGAEVRDLDGDGRRELILGDDTFAYDDDLCYACSPANLPLVACFNGTRFEDCTRRFPDLVRQRRDAYLARVVAGGDEDARQHARGAALGVVALSALLGEEQQGLDLVRKAGADETVMTWLARSLPRIHDWLEIRGRKLKDRS
jgi:hypothetical protein